jgi:hypothetical protein
MSRRVPTFWRKLLIPSLTLKMEAAASSETLDTDEPRVWQHIPEDSTIQLLVYLTVYKFVDLI